MERRIQWINHKHLSSNMIKNISDNNIRKLIQDNLWSLEIYYTNDINKTFKSIHA